MTQITLPNQNVTGPNLWSQVENNDKAIRDVVNGDLDNGNIATNANIAGSKLLAGSVGATQLGTDAVTETKIGSGAVTSAKIGSGAVTAGKVGSGAVDTAQLVDSSVTSAKIADGTIANGDIADSTIAPGKLSPVVGEANLTANLGLNYAAWNTVLTVNTGQAGTYVMMASGTFGGQNSNDIQISVGSATYGTYGMVVNANPYGSFSQQGVGYSSNGVINLVIYSYASKQAVGSGTRLSVFRIG